MSCRKTADSVAEAYAAVGTPIRFIVDEVDAAAMLAGTSPTARKVFDWYAIEEGFTVHERSAGAIAESDIKLRFAHPYGVAIPIEIYTAILEPGKEPSLRIAVALDGEIGAPTAGGGFEGAKVYRFGSVLGRSSIGTPIAHVWHLGTTGA